MAELQPQASSIEAHALARHVRMSPQKARLVMDLIRGQKAQAALQTLRYTPKRAAKHIEKVLRNAMPPLKRKPKRKRACVVPRVASAKHWPASRAVLRRARSKAATPGRSRERGDKSGTENAPLRIPPRLQQAVEVALVRGPRLR